MRCQDRFDKDVPCGAEDGAWSPKQRFSYACFKWNMFKSLLPICAARITGMRIFQPSQRTERRKPVQLIAEHFCCQDGCHDDVPCEAEDRTCGLLTFPAMHGIMERIRRRMCCHTIQRMTTLEYMQTSATPTTSFAVLEVVEISDGEAEVLPAIASSICLCGWQDAVFCFIVWDWGFTCLSCRHGTSMMLEPLSCCGYTALCKFQYSFIVLRPMKRTRVARLLKLLGPYCPKHFINYSCPMAAKTIANLAVGSA